MTEDVVTCGCGKCWCYGAATVGYPLCADCLADHHTASPSVAAANPAAPEPRKCRPHRWQTVVTDGVSVVSCARCERPRDLVASRRGRNSRSRGNRHELDVARKYGGRKIGPLGGPADVVGTLFAIQVKTHQSAPPVRLLALMEAMDVGAGGRVAIVLDRYLRPGKTPIDLVTVRGDDWIALHGVDGGGE